MQRAVRRLARDSAGRIATAAFRGDDLTAHVVREAAAHLADGGYATLLGSWLVVDEDDPEERPVAWVKETGCDAWMLASIESDPLEHAATLELELLRGCEHVRVRARASGRRISRELGARGVAEGAILLHAAKGRTTMRVDEIDEDSLEDADAPDPPRVREPRADGEGSPRRAARARDAAARRARRSASSHGRDRPRRRHVLHPADDDGGGRVVERLDGKTTLRTARRRPDAVELCRELAELGALRVS